jgi:hypothetical protein
VARKKPKGPPPNLLELRPSRLVECEHTAEGRVVLLKPKFTWGPLAKLLQPRLKRPHFKVHLDEIGTFIWDRIDGDTGVGAIADAAREHFGAKIEPVYERVKTFLNQLERGQFIRIPR